VAGDRSFIRKLVADSDRCILSKRQLRCAVLFHGYLPYIAASLCGAIPNGASVEVHCRWLPDRLSVMPVDDIAAAVAQVRDGYQRWLAI